jgi:hypothetical protein
MTFGTHSVSPPKPPDRIISRFRDNDGNSNLVAMNIPRHRLLTEIKSFPENLMFHVGRQKQGENNNAQAGWGLSWSEPGPCRVAGSPGCSGGRSQRHDAPLGQRRADRPECARRDNDEGLRASPAHVDPGKETSGGRTAAEDVTYPFTTNPHAEGRRARAAGLTEAENPYLWPPGAREDWAAGWVGEGL